MSASSRADTASGKSIVPSGNTASAIDALFQALLAHIDQQKWDSARETTLQLYKCLKVTSGKQSRSKGGWQYTPLYVVDSVLYADLLCHLQEKSDIMTKAVHLTLSLAVNSFVVSWCVCVCVVLFVSVFF